MIEPEPKPEFQVNFNDGALTLKAFDYSVTHKADCYGKLPSQYDTDFLDELVRRGYITKSRKRRSVSTSYYEKRSVR
jgi:hypothetical protein